MQLAQLTWGDEVELEFRALCKAHSFDFGVISGKFSKYVAAKNSAKPVGAELAAEFTADVCRLHWAFLDRCALEQRVKTGPSGPQRSRPAPMFSDSSSSLSIHSSSPSHSVSSSSQNSVKPPSPVSSSSPLSFSPPRGKKSKNLSQTQSSSLLSLEPVLSDEEDSIFTDANIIKQLGLTEDEVQELRFSSREYDVKTSPSLIDIYNSAAAVLPTMTNFLNESTSNPLPLHMYLLSQFWKTKTVDFTREC